MKFLQSRPQASDQDQMQSEQSRCPECDQKVIVDGNETVCSECGLVIDDTEIDRRGKVRSFGDADGSRVRYGPPNTPARHDAGIGTEIGKGRDGYGNPISSETRRRLRRQRRLNAQAKSGTKRERNQRRGFTEIRRMVCALGLDNNTRDQACRLFATAQKSDLLVGLSIESAASAVLYAVCRINETPRQLDEIESVSRVSLQRIRTAYNKFNRELALPVPPAPPEQYLSQLLSELTVGDETAYRARTLLSDLSFDELSAGSSRMAIAAGALYTARVLTGDHITQEDIADASGLTCRTVRNRYQEIAKEYDGMPANHLLDRRSCANT